MEGQRKVRQGVFAWVLVWALGLAGCGFFEEDEAFVMPVLELESASIPNGQVGVPLESVLRLTFSDPVNPGTGGGFQLDDGDGFQQILLSDARVVIEGKTVSLDLFTFLKYDKTYALSFESNAFVDDRDNPLAERFSTGFTTVSKDFTLAAPTEGVPLSNLVLTMSRPVGLGGLNGVLAERIEVTDSLFDVVAISELSIEGLKLVIAFEEALVIDSVYQIVVPEGVLTALDSDPEVVNQEFRQAFRTHDGKPRVALAQSNNVHPAGFLALAFTLPVLRSNGAIQISEAAGTPITVPEENITLSNPMEGSTRASIELSGLEGLGFDPEETKIYELFIRANSFESVAHELGNDESSFIFTTASLPVLTTTFPNPLAAEGTFRLVFDRPTAALSNHLTITRRRNVVTPEDAPSVLPARLLSHNTGRVFLYQLNLSIGGDYVLNIGESSFANVANPDLDIEPVRINFKTLGTLDIVRSEPETTLHLGTTTNLNVVRSYFNEPVQIRDHNLISMVWVTTNRVVRSIALADLSTLPVNTNRSRYMNLQLGEDLQVRLGEYKIIFPEGALYNYDYSGVFPRVEHVFLRVVEDPSPVVALASANPVIDLSASNVTLALTASRSNLRLEDQEIEIRLRNNLRLAASAPARQLIEVGADELSLSLSLNTVNLRRGRHYFLKIPSDTLVRSDNGAGNKNTFFYFRTEGEGLPYPLFVSDAADTTSTAVVDYNKEDNKPIIGLSEGSVTIKLVTAPNLTPVDRSDFIENIGLYEWYGSEAIQHMDAVENGLTIEIPGANAAHPSAHVVSLSYTNLTGSATYILRMHSVYVGRNQASPIPTEANSYEVFFEVEPSSD